MCHVDVTGVHPISIPAPPRGATLHGDFARPREPHFNSRSSARGNVLQPPCALVVDISIPAPPRGATEAASQAQVNAKLISIPAPLRGATCSQCRLMGASNFNSRPSARGDVHGVCWGYWNLISIHAPPRGATILADAGYVPIKFQFTPLREGRQQKICNFCKSFVQPSQITVL